MLPKEESSNHGFPHPFKLPSCLPMLPAGQTSWQASGQANLGNTICRETMEKAKRHRDLTNDEVTINKSVKLYPFQISTSHRHIYIHACQCTHALCIKYVFSHNDNETALYNEHTEYSLGMPYISMNQPQVHVCAPPSWTSPQLPISSHSSRLLQSPSLSSQSHTANSHWLSI